MIGIGTDIVEIARIASVLERQGERFAQRVLNPSELQVFKRHNQPERFLAKRFAGKEAASKALGTGIASGVSFQDFHIKNNIKSGAPSIALSNRALEIATALEYRKMLISLSDEKDYVVAFVTLS